MRGALPKNAKFSVLLNFKPDLLLGSASLDLLKQSGETLAGRIAYFELTPFHVPETETLPADDIWVRGGFPDSLLAPNAARSLLLAAGLYSQLPGAGYSAAWPAHCR